MCVLYCPLFSLLSAIALGKLLLHAIQSNDQRLQNITVKGDQIFNQADGIRTRSKTTKGSVDYLYLWSSGDIPLKILNVMNMF